MAKWLFTASTSAADKIKSTNSASAAKIIGGTDEMVALHGARKTAQTSIPRPSGFASLQEIVNRDDKCRKNASIEFNPKKNPPVIDLVDDSDFDDYDYDDDDDDEADAADRSSTHSTIASFQSDDDGDAAVKTCNESSETHSRRFSSSSCSSSSSSTCASTSKSTSTNDTTSRTRPRTINEMIGWTTIATGRTRDTNTHGQKNAASRTTIDLIELSSTSSSFDDDDSTHGENNARPICSNGANKDSRRDNVARIGNKKQAQFSTVAKKKPPRDSRDYFLAALPAPVSAPSTNSAMSTESATTLMPHAQATAPSTEHPVQIVTDSTSSHPSMTRTAAYTLEHFLEMWNSADINQGISTEDLENSRGVRAANRRVAAQDSGGQATAQYGRLLPLAAEKLLDNYLQVDSTRGDVVVDIGCGIGNFVLQAAMVHQCETRGIELDETRFNIALHCFDQDLKLQRQRLHLDRDNIHYAMGTTTFVHGRLEAEEHLAFLTKPSKPGGKIKAFCNNFGGVFAFLACHNKKQKYHLDDYVAGLLALMPPGSTLITLYQLPLLSPRSKVLRERRKHKLLISNDSDASFYELESFTLGKAREAVSWSSNDSNLEIYRYTRLPQNTRDGRAVFLCCNPSCPKAKNGDLIEATKIVMVSERDIEEPRVVMNTCTCKFDGRPDRANARNAQQKR